MDNINDTNYRFILICKNFYNIFHSLIKYIKYFIYFSFFISIFLTNILYYKSFHAHNNKLIYLLYKSIHYNGCILIKFVQWIYTNIELLDIKSNKIILDLFSNFFENCNIHNLNYTKKIFKKDFNIDFDSIIEIYPDFNVKSGSIAQVYRCKFKDSYKFKFSNNNINIDISNINNDFALKVVHPEIEYQLLFPVFFIKIYNFLVTHIYFLKKYSSIFNYDNFFNNLKLQINMNNEFNNIKYYYQSYYDNNYIVIPKPIISSNNILIMEYIHGLSLDELNISDFEKQKIIALINLFCKNNYLFLNYFHCDLHDSNWKIRKYNDFFQIVIYDFGYTIFNDKHEVYKNLIYYSDINKMNKLGEYLYDSICNNEKSKSDFANDFVDFINANNDNKTILFNVKNLYKFCYYNNYILKPNILEIFISLMLLKKYMDKYIFFSDINDSTVYILKMNIYYLNMCKKYNIFHNLQNFINENYINNDEFCNYIKYNNNYFDTINNNDNDIINIDI